MGSHPPSLCGAVDHSSNGSLPFSPPGAAVSGPHGECPVTPSTPITLTSIKNPFLASAPTLSLKPPGPLELADTHASSSCPTRKEGADGPGQLQPLGLGPKKPRARGGVCNPAPGHAVSPEACAHGLRDTGTRSWRLRRRRTCGRSCGRRRRRSTSASPSSTASRTCAACSSGSRA